jgi:hypothetical protein
LTEKYGEFYEDPTELAEVVKGKLQKKQTEL